MINKLKNVAAKRSAKVLTVVASKQLTKNMLRLTLQGKELASFPDDTEGAYFKFAFDNAGAEKPVMRTYTVAKFRRDQHEIDVDFMMHSSADGIVDGVALPWAIQAKAGDKVSIFGPGPARFINAEADWFLLAADMTALPALIANLAILPPDATGYLVVEILSDEDRQPLLVPKNMEVIWVVNPHAGSDASPLYDAIRQLPWPDGQVAIWTACEFKTMKRIRKYYAEDKAVAKSHLYISSYWKQGLKEEEHKAAKQVDEA
ncbi:siderophore-interacting protein [Neptunomonas qingdaonensis]|uniref:NADPH-dependent ferric siderophore reductase, contains FAD-binding and SIP domains n=1 Tax=Neptunomonas qingdaonensis TaxID=1045558 RepID=A0A1I2WKC5_9GAMM|nr:siderophore-interacting protein [Neptunomonas qingdaonensis]SFH00031.1 NADPH-dependent ferric siderophore reductase, contains FAD-binding and SIP domains [Neptunomonas qingdaonensis]